MRVLVTIQPCLCACVKKMVSEATFEQLWQRSLLCVCVCFGVHLHNFDLFNVCESRLCSQMNPPAIGESWSKSFLSIFMHPYFFLSPWQLCLRGSCFHIWSSRKCSSVHHCVCVCVCACAQGNLQHYVVIAEREAVVCVCRYSRRAESHDLVSSGLFGTLGENAPVVATPVN